MKALLAGFTGAAIAIAIGGVPLEAAPTQSTAAGPDSATLTLKTRISLAKVDGRMGCPLALQICEAQPQDFVSFSPRGSDHFPKASVVTRVRSFMCGLRLATR